MVDTQITETPLGLAFCKNNNKISYWRHGNNPLPKQKKYNTQCCNDLTIQHFLWGDSSELKLEKNKGSGFYGLHVRNKLTLNDENKCVFEESHVDTVSVV